MKKNSGAVKQLVLISIVACVALFTLVVSQASEPVSGDEVSDADLLSDIGTENLKCEVKAGEKEADDEYETIRSPSCSDDQFLLTGRCDESNAGDSSMIQAGIDLEDGSPYGAQWFCRWRGLDTGGWFSDPSEIRSRGVCCEYTDDLSSIDLDCIVREDTNVVYETGDYPLGSVTSPNCPENYFVLTGRCSESDAGGSRLLRIGIGDEVDDPYEAQWRCRWGKLDGDSEITSRAVCCTHSTN